MASVSLPITGRCYCGAVTLTADREPLIVTYCHCSDCRRVTGAPVAAFAAFPVEAVKMTPDPGKQVRVSPGVTRWFCHGCGSPLAATYDYLPGQVYLALGLLDQAAELPPSMHAHAASGLPWLILEDGLNRHASSSRAALNAAAERAR
jgi:hypothetical protein